MVTGISVGIIIVLVFAVIYTEFKGRTSTVGGMFAGAFIVLFVDFILLEKNPPIQPIDVYKGKTTLEITYRDSVAVDSVVVWKEKSK